MKEYMIQMQYHETCNRELSLVPTVYYIGLSKTGSASIYYGFPNNHVAHWHSVEYFEKLHRNSMISKYGLNLYEFIIAICKPHGIKPLIIECLRDPVARRISEIAQIKKKIVYEPFMKLLADDEFAMEPYSLKLKETYGLDLKKYQETDFAKFVLLRYEDIDERVEFFNNLGYEFVPLHKNNREKSEVYQKIKNNFRLPKERLIKIYNNPVVQQFYSQDEINTMINKWKIC